MIKENFEKLLRIMKKAWRKFFSRRKIEMEIRKGGKERYLERKEKIIPDDRFGD